MLCRELAIVVSARDADDVLASTDAQDAAALVLESHGDLAHRGLELVADAIKGLRVVGVGEAALGWH